MFDDARSKNIYKYNNHLSFLFSIFQSAFTKCLSQKIRHTRHDNKRKSHEPLPKAVKKFSPGRQVKKQENEPEPESSEDDVEQHVKEIQALWDSKKKKPTEMDHTKQLLKETRHYRQKLLKDHPDGQLSPIFKAFPCFEEGSLVSFCSCIHTYSYRDYPVDMQVFMWS